MDWARAIEINQTTLSRIVVELIAMVGLVAGEALARLPKPIYRAALRVLRPAEAAVRRLIVIAARSVVVKPQAARPMPKGLKIAGKGSGRVAFQLFDPPQRFATWRPKPIPENRRPRIWMPFDERPPGTIVLRPEDFGRPEPKPEPVADGRVDATCLGRRLSAIKQALEDLPRQAKRLARWRMRRQAKSKFTSPLRPGHPPGHREKSKDEIDWVLKECDTLAEVVEREDSS